MSKIALLIPCYNTANGTQFYIWETPSEKQLNGEYTTKLEALNNTPVGYKCLNDAWQQI